VVIQHPGEEPSLVDVLDRVVDKGIVIGAWTSVSLSGIDMITIESRVMVGSFDTYLSYSEPLRRLPAVAGPRGIVSNPASFASSENEQEPERHPEPQPRRAPRMRK
jgi:hypothetical protein